MTRTKERVLDVVGDLLVQVGPLGVTYSAVAKSAGVGRQTLYNHWASPSEMIRDAAIEGYRGGYPVEVCSAEDAARQWLTSLAGALAEPRRLAALSALIAVAARGGGDEETLRQMVAGRRRAFDELLATIGLSCPSATYARMVGPLHFQALQAREPITQELIDHIAGDVAPEMVPLRTSEG